MVTSPNAGIKRVWNVITADKYTFIILGAFCFHFYLRSAQAQVLWLLRNAKFKLIQIQSKLSASKLTGEGPTRGLGIRLTSWSIHFHS